MRVIGYLRVSTAEQAESGLGLDAQRAQLTREAEYRGWQLQLIVDEGRTGASLRRPGIRKALQAIAKGDADALAVTRLDRLSRSTADSAALFYFFEEARAGLIALDFDLDTSTPTGRLIGTFMAGLAEWERETIRDRTKRALAARRANGHAISRAAVHDHAQLAQRVRRLHDQGMTLSDIARQLNGEGVPTLRGGATWRPSALQSVVGYRRPPKQRDRRSTLPRVTKQAAGRGR